MFCYAIHPVTPLSLVPPKKTHPISHIQQQQKDSSSSSLIPRQLTHSILASCYQPYIKSGTISTTLCPLLCFALYSTRNTSSNYIPQLFVLLISELRDRPLLLFYVGPHISAQSSPLTYLNLPPQPSTMREVVSLNGMSPLYYNFTLYVYGPC